MTEPLSPEELLQKLEKLLRSKAQPIFSRYGRSIDNLVAPLKWKPLVLVIGNYSSGKSTFINELLGRDVQRVGQAPTDDCFTVLTRPAPGGEEKSVPGSSVVTDDDLPFGAMRRFGEKLASHFWLRYVDAPVLEEVAIIDTPGMLDSVTEKDRGYDYLSVLGELARLSDVIILMFDPHKAGTIKETYQAIRSTLPGSTGEDRIFYVMNRIDECDSTDDLVRSFGALCWNLSQMTGRKDIPRIFLTYAEHPAGELPCPCPEPAEDRVPANATGDTPPPLGEAIAPPVQPAPAGRHHDRFAGWRHEREELKHAVRTAPRLRLNHVFEEIDRGVRELIMQLEAYNNFHRGFMAKARQVSRIGSLLALTAFLGGDFVLRRLTGLPEEPMLGSLLAGRIRPDMLILPLACALAVALLSLLVINRVALPWHTRKILAEPDSVISLDDAYRQDLWRRVRPLVTEALRREPKKIAWKSHRRPRRRLERLLQKQLKRLYERNFGS
ncbi:MAG: dynamin family protein [Thermodesulfobacteriota bacterium]